MFTTATFDAQLLSIESSAATPPMPAPVAVVSAVKRVVTFSSS